MAIPRKQLLVCVSLATLTVGLGLRVRYLLPLPDSDMFFHFGVSRLLLERGLPLRLPEVAGLGWGQQFPDKEFLFHLLSAVAYALAGELGIHWLILLLAAGLVVLLYAVSFTERRNPCILAGVVFLLLCVDPFFIHRLYLVRPHVAAMLFFALLLLGLKRQGRSICFAAGLGFSLSYHALYLPLVTALLHDLFNFLDARGRRAFQHVLCCSLGLGLGSLLHPEFPAQLSLGWQHLLFAFQSSESIRMGAELRGLSLLDSLQRSPLVYACFCFGVMYQLRRWRALEVYERFIVVTTSLFFVLTLKNPRGIEYFLPLTIVLFNQTLAALPGRRLPQLIIGSAAGLVVLVSVSRNDWLWRATAPNVNQGRLAALYAATAIARHAGAGAAGATTIFNCSFNTGPYLLYAVPNARFIDLLDPRLLAHSNPSLYHAREALLRQESTEALMEGIKQHFPSEYLICMDEQVKRLLDESQKVTRLYPQRAEQRAAVHSYFLRP